MRYLMHIDVSFEAVRQASWNEIRAERGRQLRDKRDQREGRIAVNY